MKEKMISFVTKVAIKVDETLKNEKGLSGVAFGIIVGSLLVLAGIAMKATIDTNTATINGNYWTWIISKLSGVWS